MAKNLRRHFTQKLNQKQSVLQHFPGTLGDGEGNVETGTPNLVFVRVGQIVEKAICTSVPHVMDLPVVVGYPAHAPLQLHVLTQRRIGGVGSDEIQPEVSPHAASHEWMGPGPLGGTDVLKVHLQQFLPLRVYPYSAVGLYGPQVAVYPGMVWTGSAWVMVADTNTYGMPVPTVVDLSEYLPGTDGKALFVLITIDNTGELVTTAGSEADIGVLALSDIPAAPANTRFVLAAVRLWYGQTAVVENRDGTDIVDLRYPAAHYHEISEIAAHDHDEDYAPYILDKLDATTAPTAADDSGDGYAVGSVWVDVTADKSYICLDATATAAVWAEMGITGGTGDMEKTTYDTDDDGVVDNAEKLTTEEVEVLTLPADPNCLNVRAVDNNQYTRLLIQPHGVASTGDTAIHLYYSRTVEGAAKELFLGIGANHGANQYLVASGDAGGSGGHLPILFIMEENTTQYPVMRMNADQGVQFWKYIDILEMSTPAAPAVNVGRIYARDDSGTTKLYYKRSDNTEIELGGAGHNAVTVSDSATIDFTLTGQELEAAVIPGGIKLDDLGAPDDNSDLNASTAKHGLLPKLPGGTTQFLRADGAFATPAGGGDVTGPASAVDGHLAVFDGATGTIIKDGGAVPSGGSGSVLEVQVFS